LAAVDRNSDCAFIDAKGEQALRLPSPVGDQHNCVTIWSDFVDGLTPWLSNGKYGYIDQSGKTVISPQFDLPGSFSEGLAPVMIDKKWGYINNTGAWIVRPEFSTAKPFHHGLAQVFYKDGRNGYIDRNGKFVWGPKESKETDE
jgi:hypothetical protein